MHHRHPAPARLLILILIAIVRPALAGDDYERWYAMDMGKSRAGWMYQSQKTQGNLITSISKTQIEIARGQVSLKIVIEGTFVETTVGKPVSLTTRMLASKQETLLSAKFGEKDIEVTLTQAGHAQKSVKPLPDGLWLTPAAAMDFVKQRLAASAESITVRTLEPVGTLTDPMAALRPVTFERTGFSTVDFDFQGKTIKARRCTTTTSSQPNIKAIEVLDDQGIALSTEQDAGFVKIVARATTKADALAVGGENPELLVSTFIKPDKPIAGPRGAKKAVYIISVADGKLPEFPVTGTQRIEPIDATSCRLIVDETAPTPDDPGDAGAAKYTACSATLNCDDPEIKKLAAQATAKTGPAKSDRAEAIRDFVYGFIDKKDLDVGFANATEVARRRHGDCTEHGVLAAALLRADGIPSRVVGGLIYADQFEGSQSVFAYHMWAQGLLEVNGKPTWIDFDATLPDQPFDATHIALAVSPLADGEPHDALVSLATMLGRLRIAVEKTE